MSFDVLHGQGGYAPSRLAVKRVLNHSSGAPHGRLSSLEKVFLYSVIYLLTFLMLAASTERPPIRRMSDYNRLHTSSTIFLTSVELYHSVISKQAVFPCISLLPCLPIVLFLLSWLRKDFAFHCLGQASGGGGGGGGFGDKCRSSFLFCGILWTKPSKHLTENKDICDMELPCAIII